jgi:hypothetical protein
MNFSIRKQGDLVFAELQGRETSYDMREFLMAVKLACQQHGCPRILITVRDSRAMFKAEDYGLTAQTAGYVKDLVTPACRIALVGDTSELNFAHEYIELVARQQDVNVKSFKDPGSAARWLEAQQGGSDAAAQEGLDALEPGGTPKLA